MRKDAEVRAFDAPRLKRMTFHKFLSGSQRGDRESWHVFLSNYTPVALRLCSLYLLFAPQEQMAFWHDVLLALWANDYECLRGFPQQAEREFLVGLRAFLLDLALPLLDPSRDSTVAPPPTVETLGELFKGLPLFHQETIFLKLAGYSNTTLEKMLKIGPAVAEKRLERLRPGYAAALEETDDKCFWPVGWLQMTRLLRSGRQPACAPLRQFARILDGQTSWYEKTSIEEHMGGCLSCLEQWIALREVVFWLREAKPLPSERIAPLLSSLPFSEDTRQAKSFLMRMLGR
jgi:hypothetical protein